MSKLQYKLLALIIGVVTVIFGTIYVTQQQSLRVGANDPQIQIAEDAAAALNADSVPESFMNGKVDISNSLAPFVIIYGKSGKVVGGTGYLDGKIPVVPLGVLENSKGKDYNFVTWQPKSGVRIASVSVSAKNYYVLSGRSLKEVEKRIDSLFNYVVFGCAFTVSLVLLGVLIYPRVSLSKKS